MKNKYYILLPIIFIILLYFVVQNDNQYKGTLDSEGRLIIHTKKCDTYEINFTLRNNYGMMIKSERNFFRKQNKLYFYNQNQKTIFVTDNINLFLDEIKKIPENEIFDYYKTCSSPSYDISEIEKICKQNNIQFYGVDNDSPNNYNLLCTCCGG